MKVVEVAPAVRKRPREKVITQIHAGEAAEAADGVRQSAREVIGGVAAESACHATAMRGERHGVSVESHSSNDAK